MQAQVLATIAYECGSLVGDTSTSFLAKIKVFLNDRYDDALMRSGATTWAYGSGATYSAALGDTSLPILGLGKVIKQGGISDAWAAKRQFNKAAVYDNKYEFALKNFIISGDYQQFNVSLSRYGYLE